ncbi:aldo/keto reductase [Salsipaludibacter albus]|uniref:aldo/keto reductase n=1 Tax=Salsipaludibacter albus TaxID=2849650 RepID=UPI001EE40F05|nr:aldo/keto reductase [Salsipaludibacter albus]MBY5161456.1 aldo/keto reductase [Salsipaludibacter albus]
MHTRRLYQGGPEVSEIGFGAWAIGGSWGEVDDDESMAALHAAVDAGVTFVDTADVYGDGHSEQLVGRLLRERDEDLVVATKAGRRAEVDPANWTADTFAAWLDRSRRNLDVETIDLVQLHCLGEEVYRTPEVWAALDGLRSRGVVRAWGVSVETVDEAMAALDAPGVRTVQIIFNLFRTKPAEEFLDAARRAGVGVIVRVPLASGLLTGKFDADSSFASDDHRNFNRDGQAFDVGETFAGVDFDTGLAAVQRLEELVPETMSMAQFALRWILDHDAVSTVIPGARTPRQAADNAAASDFAPLGSDIHRAAREVYDDLVRPQVHDRW